MENELKNVRNIVFEAEEAKKNNSMILMNYSEAYGGE